jgi:toxin FitB
MIILDTNVLSALMRPEPEAVVVKWLDQQPRSSIWTTSITLMEIRYGIQIMPAGRRSERLAELELVLREEFAERCLVFDIVAAERSAQLMALRKIRGRPVDLRDTLIAGIALANRATLATRNISHFEDLTVPVVSPWSA